MLAFSGLKIAAATVLMAGLLVAPEAWADCSCVNRDGIRFGLGQTACLNVDGRSYLALCELNLNVTSWKKIDDSCPQASNHILKQSLWQRIAAPPA
jgi:hypothetical protein